VNAPRFVEKDIAASREIWWELLQGFEDNLGAEHRAIIKSGLRSFLGEYFDKSKCTVSREQAIEILLHIKLRYTWAKQSFDGGYAYKKTDALVRKLDKIGKLAEQLASECNDIETLHFVGKSALNLGRLADLRDSQGLEHQSIDTFAGGLMTRVCVDSTVVAEGLFGIRERTLRAGGRPPVVSNTYLILTAMDLYENVFGLGEVSVTGPKEPTGPGDYVGHFYNFVDCYTAIIACDDFKIGKGV